MKAITYQEYQVEIYYYDSQCPAYPISPRIEEFYADKEGAALYAFDLKRTYSLNDKTKHFVVKLVERTITEQDLDVDSIIDKMS